MKGVLVILDGVGDGPCSSLGGKTPLEAAKTPHLDALARRGKMDYCWTVKKGFVPESHQGIMSLLGYDLVDEDRGTLEALGLGVKLNPGDLALRCNFATVEDLHSRKVLDRRAGRTLTTNEARELAKVINKEVKLGYPFEFVPGVQHRAVLVIRGGFSANITEVDVDKQGRFTWVRGQDEEEDTALAAELVNRFLRESHRVLEGHEVNMDRVRKGLFAANFVLCRGAGNQVPRLKKVKGKWMGLSYMPLESGIEKVSGMDLYTFRYPKMKNLDVYRNLYDGLSKALTQSVRMMRWYWKKKDYFLVYLKETDVPGHDNKPLDKVAMLERIDKGLFSYLEKWARKHGIRVVVTADHSTPCAAKGHSADPVPVLTSPWGGAWAEVEEKARRFTEQEGMKGRGLLGKQVLPERLFA